MVQVGVFIDNHLVFPGCLVTDGKFEIIAFNVRRVAHLVVIEVLTRLVYKLNPTVSSLIS